MIYMELENKDYAMHKVMKYLTKLRGDINVQQKYIYSKKLDHWVNVMVGGGFEERYKSLLQSNEGKFRTIVLEILNNSNRNQPNFRATRGFFANRDRLISIFNQGLRVPVLGRRRGKEAFNDFITERAMTDLISRTTLTPNGNLQFDYQFIK